MAEKKDEKREYTPQDLNRAQGGYDPEKLAEQAEASRQAVQGGPNPQEGGPVHPTQQEHAEQQREQDKAREAHRDRDDILIKSGRGRHTTGRMGGVE